VVSCREAGRRLVVTLSDSTELIASRSGSQNLRALIV